jgi:hypothetical protein
MEHPADSWKKNLGVIPTKPLKSQRRLAFESHARNPQANSIIADSDAFVRFFLRFFLALARDVRAIEIAPHRTHGLCDPAPQRSTPMNNREPEVRR